MYLSLIDQAEKGNGPPEGRFMKLGGKANFGVLRSKIDVTRAKKGAISLVLTNRASGGGISSSANGMVI